MQRRQVASRMAEGDAGIVGHRQDQFGVAQVVQALLAAPLEHVRTTPGGGPRSGSPQPVRQRSPNPGNAPGFRPFRRAARPPAGGSRRCRRNAARPGRRSARPLRANRVRGRRATCSACRLRSEAGNRRQAPEFAAHRGVGEACLQALEHEPRTGLALAAVERRQVGQALGQGRLVAQREEDADPSTTSRAPPQAVAISVRRRPWPPAGPCRTARGRNSGRRRRTP